MNVSRDSGGGEDPRRLSPIEARVPMPHREVSAYSLDDELVVYDARGAQAYVLNITAAHIWSRCDGSRNVESVAQEIAEAYALSYQQALADVRELLHNLQQAGLLAD
jgi:Coenzyme PQQ synthesis protein D (PqqD)